VGLALSKSLQALRQRERARPMASAIVAEACQHLREWRAAGRKADTKSCKRGRSQHCV